MSSAYTSAYIPPGAPRYLVHSFYNNTPIPLHLCRDLHLSGRWYAVPQSYIQPNDLATYSSCNIDNSFMTGTCGVIVYRLADTNHHLALFFSNPYVGSYKAGAKLYQQLPTYEMLNSDYNDHQIVLSDANTVQYDQFLIQTSPAITSNTPVQFILKFINNSVNHAPKFLFGAELFPYEFPLPREYPLVIPRNQPPPFQLSILSLNFSLTIDDIPPSTLIHLLKTFGDMAMSQYDVVCLHQVNNLKLQQSLIIFGKQFHLDYYYHPPVPVQSSDWTEQPNLLILSRFPITAITKLFSFPTPTASNIGSPGFICCKVQLPKNKVFNLVVVQFQHGPDKKSYLNRESNTNTKQDTKQILELRSQPASYRYSQCIEFATELQLWPELTYEGCIIVGNFNMIGGSLEYDRFMSTMRHVVGGGPTTEFIDLFVEADMMSSTWFPSLSLDQEQDVQLQSVDSGLRLDFIFFLKTGHKLTADVPESRFQVDINKFVLGDTSHLDRLTDHDGLCVYVN